jgi:hypothetical protein
MKTIHENSVAEAIENQTQTISVQERVKTIRVKHISTSLKGVLRSMKAGKRGIYIRLTIDGESEYYPTRYFVDENNFDKKSGFVKGNEDCKDAANSYVRYLINELDVILSELKRSGEIVSRDNFRRYYNRRLKRDMRFDDYFKAALEEK